MTSILFDLAKDGYSWAPLLLGILFALIFGSGWYLARNQRAPAVMARMGVSFVLCCVWLGIGTFGTYTDYARAKRLTHIQDVHAVEGVVVLLPAHESDGPCDGFRVQTIDVCFAANFHVLRVGGKRWLTNGTWVRMWYGYDPLVPHDLIVLRIEQPLRATHP